MKFVFFNQGSQTHRQLATYGSSLQLKGHLTDPISVTQCYSAQCQRMFLFKIFSVIGLKEQKSLKLNIKTYFHFLTKSLRYS